MSHPIDTRDILISIATAALEAAEVDAALTGDLIFRPEWKATLRTRTRNPTSQPQRAPPDAGTRRSSSWFSKLVERLDLTELLPEEDRPSSQPPPAAPAPPFVSESAPPPLAESVPTSQPPPRHPPPPSPQPQLREGAVGELIKRNQDVYDKIINHRFPQALGNGTASLDGFRYYMIQDKLYLETYTRLKMISVAATPSFKDVEKFSKRHDSTLDYINKLKNICTTWLGLPESTIDNTSRSNQIDASENFYMTSVRQHDPLLGYYVVLAPCILSYWDIAQSLMQDPSTARNVVFHKAWTEFNYDPSSTTKYTKFINENIAAKGGVDKWNHLFRIACMLEADLFETGLKPPTSFQMIPDGTYFIQSSSLQGVVLAVQNVRGFLQPPLDQLIRGYFPSDVGSSVVGVNKTGGNNEKWNVVVTKDGYTFQNLGTGLYLGIASEINRKEGRILQAGTSPYYWWINPAQSQPGQGSTSYQIHESANLRHTLHADTEILKSVNSNESINFHYTPVVTRENEDFKGPYQMWSFSDESGNPINNVLNNMDSGQAPAPNVAHESANSSNDGNKPPSNPTVPGDKAQPREIYVALSRIEVNWLLIWDEDDALSGEFRTGGAQPPDPTFHWGIRVGDFVHQLDYDVNCVVRYRCVKFRAGNKWKLFHVGNTMRDDADIRKAGEIVIQEMHGRYNLWDNNCQTFVMNLLKVILVGSSVAPPVTGSVSPQGPGEDGAFRKAMKDAKELMRKETRRM